MNILLALTGSVAAIRYPELVSGLSTLGSVSTITTEKGWYFASKSNEKLPSTPIYHDKDEWNWEARGDVVLHITLRDWADVLVVAPLSANTLAKISHGFADNLVTSVIRAWKKEKPLILAPAMNTAMWESPFTAQQLHTLNTYFFVHTISPIEKKLACGDIGVGGIADTDIIVNEVRRHL